MVMLGAMTGVRERLHFDVDVWPELKPKTDAMLRMAGNVFVLIFALTFIWWGWQFTSPTGSRPPRSPTCRCG